MPLRPITSIAFAWHVSMSDGLQNTVKIKLDTPQAACDTVSTVEKPTTETAMKTIYRVFTVGGGFYDFEGREAAKYWVAMQESKGMSAQMVRMRVPK